LTDIRYILILNTSLEMCANTCLPDSKHLIANVIKTYHVLLCNIQNAGPTLSQLLCAACMLLLLAISDKIKIYVVVIVYISCLVGMMHVFVTVHKRYSRQYK